VTLGGGIAFGARRETMGYPMVGVGEASHMLGTSARVGTEELWSR